MNCLLDEEPKHTNSEGLTIHALLKADTPFSFIAEDENRNRLSVSGTVKETDSKDFTVENVRLVGFGMSVGGIYTSKETREMRKELQAVLGADSHCNPNDPPEAVGGGWWVSIGPGYRLSIKRLVTPQPTIVCPGASVILSWPRNTTAFTLQSTTNLDSPVWNTDLATPVVVNGQYTVTNPISGQQQFFRLSQQ